MAVPLCDQQVRALRCQKSAECGKARVYVVSVICAALFLVAAAVASVGEEAGTYPDHRTLPSAGRKWKTT